MVEWLFRNLAPERVVRTRRRAEPPEGGTTNDTKASAVSPAAVTGSPARQPVLELEDISKSFPGARALDGISLTVRAGEIHALIGENGAGKSTLMKILAGILSPDSGRIRLNGCAVAPGSPAAALQLGIGLVHQEISLAPNLTVAENIFVGREPTWCGLINWPELEHQAGLLLTSFGVTLPPRTPVRTLNLATRQVVEIARAVALRPKLLMLDEPTSALEAHEVDRLFEVLRRLARTGIGILYVTHKLKEVSAIADTVTVLRDGTRVASKPAADTNLDELIRLLVGREVDQMYPAKGSQLGAELLRVERLRPEGFSTEISFKLRQREILGLAGLAGAGRSELAQALFGYRPRESGRIFLDGRELAVEMPADAVRAGIAYLPEDRKLSGLFEGMSVADNVVAASLKQHSRFGLVSRRKIDATTAGCVDRFRIRTPSVRQRIARLSGGNQQKVLLARWLETKPRVLIVDEPTRGIDVGAKAEIHALLRHLCEQGIGVVVISSELPEILGLCDRVLVLHESRLVGELAGNELSEAAVMRLAAGVEERRHL